MRPPRSIDPADSSRHGSTETTSDSGEERYPFISYSSIDRDRTQPLGFFVESLDYEVFHDWPKLRAGAEWEPQLMEALDRATTLIVFWAKNSAKSEWVREDYEHFARKHPDGS